MWGTRRYGMATRSGDMKQGASFTLIKTASGFAIKTESPKNTWGDPEFVEFTCSGTRSLETLLALSNLYRSLMIEGIFLANNNFALRLLEGTIEMLQDLDGDKYIRVWNPAIKESCEIEINQRNVSSTILHRLHGLLIAMELDDKLHPV